MRINEDYYIEDAGSRNGTFLNGERIFGRQKLQVGDRIFIGNSCFLFSLRVTETGIIPDRTDTLSQFSRGDLQLAPSSY